MSDDHIDGLLDEQRLVLNRLSNALDQLELASRFRSIADEPRANPDTRAKAAAGVLTISNAVAETLELYGPLVESFAYLTVHPDYSDLRDDNLRCAEIIAKIKNNTHFRDRSHPAPATSATLATKCSDNCICFNRQTKDMGQIPTLGRQMTSVWEKVENAAVSGAAELNLSGCSLAEIPLKVFELTSLQVLDLHDNQITTLPPGIGKLTSLQKLHLHNNRLTTLPPEIGRLALLRELKLYNNRLTTLPPEIGNLTSLQWLYLCNNQLTTLPSKIGNLTSLQQLRLDNNQLTTLPASLISLTSLRRLNLTNNPITYIPSILTFHPLIRREFININGHL
jgi:Leucine-rich repeat (LRR) protein